MTSVTENKPTKPEMLTHLRLPNLYCGKNKQKAKFVHKMQINFDRIVQDNQFNKGNRCQLEVQPSLGSVADSIECVTGNAWIDRRVLF